MDWEKLGLKMGLEIHQQLNTKHKLFCPCKTELVDEDYNEIVERNRCGISGFHLYWHNRAIFLNQKFQFMVVIRFIIV